MTIPKATRYRIRRLPVIPDGNTDKVSPPGPATGGASPGEPEPMAPRPTEDGFDPQIFKPVVPPAQEGPSEQDIAAIQAEGLAGRQLRLARRIALRHGIAAASDHEAVWRLRQRGIDPFDRSALLGLDDHPDEAQAEVVPPPVPAREKGKALAKIVPPGTTVPGPQRRTMPGTQPDGDVDRAREIVRIQRDIARRRRRKLLFLGLRLAFFVLLPTLVVGWYYFAIATPMYATKSEFVIQKADSVAGGSGLGGLFAGTQLATNQDSITVQSFLQSRDAMLRLEQEQKFKEHFAQPGIDPLQRLPEWASNEAAYKLYQRNVKIGYDPSEGVIRMEVIATDPQSSERFSKALISYAEQQVDRLTSRLREDQMRGARESYEDSQSKVLEAQARVLQLQEQVGVLDPVSENSLVMTQLSTLQAQLEAKRLELNQLLDNSQPSAARVEGARGDIRRLEGSIAAMRAQLTQASGTTESLASVTGQLRIAEAELETRQALMATAAQQMEAARIEANKQVRYLETGVRPVAPDEATYPRAFEDTLLAFLIFSGIYLMLSLTVSILREQVSS